MQSKYLWNTDCCDALQCQNTWREDIQCSVIDYCKFDYSLKLIKEMGFWVQDIDSVCNDTKC